MTGRTTRLVAALLLSATVASPTLAGWKLISAQNATVIDGMTITPSSDWNAASTKPGKQGQSWTHDGLGLNALELFAGVPTGKPLYRERDHKRNPMPAFDPTMLLPDYADFFERSFRASYPVADFVVLESVPGRFGGHPALSLRYRFTLANDPLQRLGIARLAVAGGKFYAANFHAPGLHYFQAGRVEAEAMMDSARF